MPPRPQRFVSDKKIDKKSLKRLLSYVFSRYGFRFVIVFICICLSSVSTVIVNNFMARLIDTVIIPGLDTGFDAIKGRLYEIIFYMIIFDIVGVVAITAVQCQMR